MNRIRGGYPTEAQLYGEAPRSKLPVRILLIAAAVVLMSFVLFLRYTGAAVMCIYNWIYPGAVMLFILLLLGAGCAAVAQRIKKERPRRFAIIAMVVVMLMLFVSGISFCSVSHDMLLKPIGYDTSPGGENQIVILRTVTDEGDEYTAFPAVNRYFYVAALGSESVLSGGVIQGVEWEGERLARVTITDLEGNDRIMTVDFASLYEEDGEDKAS